MPDEPVKKGGYVYFMTNQAMPGHVKIGSTRLHPDERARQLSSGTAVARPFKTIAFEWFEDGALLHAERELQAKYRQHRVPKREFFEIDLTAEQAQAALLELCNLLAVGKPLDQALPPASPTTKSVNPTSDRGETNASVLGLPYWTEFNKVRNARKLLPPFENAGPRFFHRYFLVKPSQKTGFCNIHYEGRIRITDPQVSMRLIFKTAADIKEMFDLIAQDRDTIERDVGFRLQWLRDRGLKESHIAVEQDNMDPRDATNWQRQHEWLSDIVSAFERCIAPRVAKLPSIAR
jgi:T5orf172 domain/Domain of unknown function (DUF4268)